MDDENTRAARAALATVSDSLPAPSSDAIRIRGLSKRFGETLALDGLSLSVPRGSFFGFLGPNGAGKTTTIHILTGVFEADAGQVEVLDMPMPRKADVIKQSLGVVPDDSVLFDRLRGLEFLEFVGRVYGLDSRTAIDRGRELMELFELEIDTTALIAGYSKGMRKRLALAAALIHRPQLFLLDEPFEGVDPVGARLMKDILVKQVERGGDGLPYLTRAGSRRAPVRPGGDHRERKHSGRGIDGRDAHGGRNAGGPICPPRWRR